MRSPPSSIGGRHRSIRLGRHGSQPVLTPRTPRRAVRVHSGLWRGGDAQRCLGASSHRIRLSIIVKVEAAAGRSRSLLLVSKSTPAQHRHAAPRAGSTRRVREPAECAINRELRPHRRITIQPAIAEDRDARRTRGGVRGPRTLRVPPPACRLFPHASHLARDVHRGAAPGGGEEIVTGNGEHAVFLPPSSARGHAAATSPRHAADTPRASVRPTCRRTPALTSSRSRAEVMRGSEGSGSEQNMSPCNHVTLRAPRPAPAAAGQPRRHFAGRSDRECH